MIQLLLYILPAFVFGFGIAWIIHIKFIGKLKRSQRSIEGLLESEKLMKEKLRKENQVVYQMKECVQADLGRKLKEAEALKMAMDEDIILLQKHNEETEALLQAGQPEIHRLKLKLVEANNTIARYKAQLADKVKTA